MDGILPRAREFRTQTLSRLERTATWPSKLWADLHVAMHQRAIAELDSLKAFCAFLTEKNAFTFPRLTNDPQCSEVASRLLSHLIANGTPLDGFSSLIEESKFAGEGSYGR